MDGEGGGEVGRVEGVDEGVDEGGGEGEGGRVRPEEGHGPPEVLIDAEASLSSAR